MAADDLFVAATLFHHNDADVVLLTLGAEPLAILKPVSGSRIPTTVAYAGGLSLGGVLCTHALPMCNI